MTEFRPGGFQVIPTVIKNLIIFNALVWIGQLTFKNDFLENLFALHDIRSVYFKPHQLLTYMFLHGKSPEHIFFNMFALWMFGATLENLWGAKRFLTFYVLCGIGAGALHLGVLYMELTPVWDAFKSFPDDVQQYWLYRDDFKMNGATLGASGSVFGLLAAFGYLFPNSLIYVYFLFPIKVKWFVIFYAAAELFAGVRNSAGDNVAHWAHLGGAAVGILIVWIWNKKNKKTFY